MIPGLENVCLAWLRTFQVSDDFVVVVWCTDIWLVLEHWWKWWNWCDSGLTNVCFSSVCTLQETMWSQSRPCAISIMLPVYIQFLLLICALRLNISIYCCMLNQSKDITCEWLKHRVWVDTTGKYQFGMYSYGLLTILVLETVCLTQYKDNYWWPPNGYQLNWKWKNIPLNKPWILLVYQL